MIQKLLFGVILFASFSASGTIKKVCDTVGSQSAVHGLRLLDIPAEWDNLNAQELADRIFARIPQNSVNLDYSAMAPWVLQMSANPTFKRAGYILQKKLAQRLLGRFGITDTLENYLKTVDPIKTYSNEYLAHIDGLFKQLDENKYTFLESARQIIPIACHKYPSRNCKGATNKALDIGYPSVIANAAISNMGAFRTFLTAPSLQGALIGIANDLLAGSLDKADLSEVLSGRLRQQGLSDAEANKLAWAFWGFFGSRGTSVDLLQPFFHQENLPLFVPYYIITAGGALIDAKQTVTQGTAFSIPHDISTTCLTGRPYHFWMAASITQQLIEEGFHGDDAMVAVHLAGLGYEFLSSTWGRDPTKPFTSKNVYVRRGIQVGISYKTLGSWWAFRKLAGKKSKHSYDRALKLMIRRSINLPPLDRSQMPVDQYVDSKKEVAFMFSLYPYWERIIAPDSVLNRLRLANLWPLN